MTGDITMGENDYCHLDEGWHPLEEIPDGVRWTSRRASFRIAISGQTTLRLRFLSFDPGLEDDPARGYVEMAGRVIGPICISRSGWHELDLPLPIDEQAADGSTARTVHGAIVTENVWVPAKVLKSSVCEPVIGMPRFVTGSFDTRELGIAVQRIWVE